MTDLPSKPRVLVVDDEPQILDSIHGLLEDEFDVLVSTDPVQAVQFLKDAAFAVILVDQRMPKLTGGELLSKARDLSDATRILITGYVDIDALIRAVNDGQIHSYVPKPWDPASLRRTVQNAATYAKEVGERRKAADMLAEQQQALARSEAAHRHQTKILRSVLDSMSDGVLVADENGEMLLLNPAADELVGTDFPIASHWERAELIGIYVPGTNVLYPRDKLPLARAMRGEVADAIELYIRNARHPEGLFVSVNVRPLKNDEGENKGGVAVVRDITAAKSSEDLLRRAKEEAQRANGAKSEFLSRMSHELRTPLNSVLGFAQLLALADLAAPHQSNVQHILKGGYHLLELINEVLDLARIEAGKLGMSIEPVQINHVVTEALDLVRPIITAQKITLSADLAGLGERHVLADRQRLKQVLLNLLSNAIKFNSSNGKVVLTCAETGGGRLRIEVADTGLGISEDGLAKIFTPFERLNADQNAVSGTGLGLALSKRMIEAMGGTIGVDSKPGAGSKFHFELSQVEHAVERTEERLPSAPAPSGHNQFVRGTVLYIEDNLSNARLMEEIVARYPRVELLEAIQGKIGIDLANTHAPDWILLDLHLPDLTGEEILRRLKSNPRTTRIPVTILSADATSGQVSHLKAAGARDYLTKPLNVRHLIQLLEATLESERPAADPTHGSDGHREPNKQPEPVWSWTPDHVPLSGLPHELLDEMRCAVKDGQKDRLDELIAAVAAQDYRCANALQGLADNYDYDALTDLLTGMTV